MEPHINQVQIRLTIVSESNVYKQCKKIIVLPYTANITHDKNCEFMEFKQSDCNMVIQLINQCASFRRGCAQNDKIIGMSNQEESVGIPEEGNIYVCMILYGKRLACDYNIFNIYGNIRFECFCPNKLTDTILHQ